MGSSGDAGNSIKTVLGDSAVIVGDHPNVNPSVWVEPTGKEIDSYSMSGSGMMRIKSAMPTFRSIDNAGDFHGGNYTVTAMNGIHFEGAAGGFTVDVSGNISLSAWGGKANITATTQVGVLAQVVQINATNTLKIGGKSLYVDCKETTFNSNVTFGKNVKVNGGLAVNGELYVSHITGMRSVKKTTVSSPINSYINVASELQAIIAPGLGGTLTIDGGIAPGPIILKPIPDGLPFVTSMPHIHYYETIPITPVNGPTDLFSEMESVEGDTPVEAKPNTLDDLDPSKTLAKVGKMFTDAAKTFIGL